MGGYSYRRVHTFVLILAVLVIAVNSSSPKKHRHEEGKHIDWSDDFTKTEIIEYLLQDYDRRLPPSQENTTVVEIGIYVNSFDSISEQSMDYQINIYLRLNWTDPRLSYSTATNISKIKMEDGIWNKVWIPDIFFRNEKEAKFHEVTVANRFMVLKPTGNLWYVSKITATLSCPMELHKYPLDTQKCPMMFESFGHTTKVVDFAFLRKGSFETDSSLTIPQFQLIDHELINCSQNYTTGMYPCLRLNFVLRRDLGFYLIQVYIPSILIVILSWVSFWIGGDATVGRVTLGLLTVLSMTTQSTSAQSDLAKVSYIKALDVWMSTCLLFVFSAFLEFAVVNVLTRVEVKRSIIYRDSGKAYNNHQSRPNSRPHERMTLLEPPPPMPPMPRDTEGAGSSTSSSTQRMSENGEGGNTNVRWVSDPFGREKAKTVDAMSRRLFPGAFVLFNITYWTVFCYFLEEK